MPVIVIRDILEPIAQDVDAQLARHGQTNPLEVHQPTLNSLNAPTLERVMKPRASVFAKLVLPASPVEDCNVQVTVMVTESVSQQTSFTIGNRDRWFHNLQ